jgi:hypothetical protein
MTRFSTVLAAGALALAAPTASDARCRYCGVPPGVIGAYPGGVIVAGGAPRWPYYYAPGYVPGHVYEGPAYFGGYEADDFIYPVPDPYPRHGHSTADVTNRHRMMQGTR